uniref:DSBA-like thioredoxin domain-containing protein n=1 Tax=Panagrolaimus sp. JU765 TaxID=591449 RepID=A0AC34Q884_9BILA
MANLKLLFHFDILCPHSFLGYQILQQKLPKLLEKKNFEVDYIPVMGPKIFRSANGTLYDGLASPKRDYILHELELIAKLYNLKRPEKFYWGSKLLDKRSVSALLFLNGTKRTNEKLFKMFRERFFDDIWLKNEKLNKVSKFFRVGRELGLEFREMDDLISKLESIQNVKPLLDKTNQLILEDVSCT